MRGINLVLALFCAVSMIRPAQAGNADLAWPALTRETRPWTYWWWMGSAVDSTNITRELTRYRDAGLGGVHIIPIYGAKGWEDRYIDYLSSRWMEMLRHTVAEAERLGLGVDMTTGTGWCFGGPIITDEQANALAVLKVIDVLPDGKPGERINPQSHAVMAFSSEGKRIELTGRMTAEGDIDWTAPEGESWQVYVVSQRPSGQKVKRAAPGGQGHMLNLMYPEAVRSFLRPFTDAFDNYDGPKPRAQYHDSYEYRSEWSPEFFAEFEKRRGYRLQDELPAFFDRAARFNASTLQPFNDPNHTARLKCDYRETVSDLMIEEGLPLWTEWSRARGFLTRNEAHGSPGNLLDLYALADIPETEMFHKDRNKLISKFASSAAHVSGRKLVSCETATWLREHFTETLADVKYLLDDLFVSGVNHIFYHGTCFSPDDAGWPGWVFYASTQMNPRNSIWRDAPALNDYIARCQSILQSGKPDNDILLYWPIHDLWHNPTGMVRHLTVHARDWFEAQPIGKTAESLWRRGFAFDYVSDRQLATATVAKQSFRLPGGEYRAVLVPACERMPLETLRTLLTLAEAGGTVVFENLPGDVPGLADLDRRRVELRNLVAKLERGARAVAGVREIKIGQGRIIVGNAEGAFARAGIAREPMVDHPGVYFTRRMFDGGHHYFIANRGEKAIEGWIPLGRAARSVVLMDASSGRAGVGASRSERRQTQVYLQLNPGESVVVRTFSERKATGTVWNYWTPAGAPHEIGGEWQVSFVHGGPTLPPAFRTSQLTSWTDLGGEEAKRFAGTARYAITFDAPRQRTELQAVSTLQPFNPASTRWFLDLGQVSQSARVKLNGQDLGTLITPPFRVVVNNLKPTGNLLEVEVTSVSANRIRDLDRRGIQWRTFHDINFVNINYKPFDASEWPLAESGLLGPVTLQAARALDGGKDFAR